MDERHRDRLESDACTEQPRRILAIDVGAGTQDVLLYESDKTPENCVKLVLPSQTQIVGRRIRAATAIGRPVHLTGTLMRSEERRVGKECRSRWSPYH